MKIDITLVEDGEAVKIDAAQTEAFVTELAVARKLHCKRLAHGQYRLEIGGNDPLGILEDLKGIFYDMGVSFSSLFKGD